MDIKKTKVNKPLPKRGLTGISSATPLVNLGRYKNLEQIGEGGLARVYKAYDSKLQRHVALKVLRKGVASSETVKQRFMQEIKMQANISLPGCIKIFDWGEEKGLVYCSMEFIEGKSLKEFYSEKQLTNQEKTKVLIQILEVISGLHNQGFEHRDLKPGNIIIDNNNRIHLLDFGLSKALNPKLNIYTTTYGEFFGTPAYMSPENIDASDKKPKDFYSDIYAFGVMAYELFTSKLPYELDHLDKDEITYVIKNEQPESLLKHSPDINISIAKCIEKALNKNPLLRPSASEILSSFKSSQELELPPKNAKYESFYTKLIHKKIIKPNRFKKTLLASAACIIAVLIVFFGLFTYKNNNLPMTKKKSSNNLFKSKTFVIPTLDISMVNIEPGSFTVRVPEEKHILITNSFFISTHEITIEQYKKAPLKMPKSANINKLNLPITNVSWHEAVKYCRFITAKEKEAGRLPEGYEYRLPTEAEWEYAASAGSKELYYFGSIQERLPLYAVYDTAKIANIKSKKPNKLGLYDILGNVWEWCYDAEGEKSILARLNPVTKGELHSNRAIRGGSASTDSKNTTLAAQRYISPHTLNNRIGFRIVLGKKINNH